MGEEDPSQKNIEDLAGKSLQELIELYRSNQISPGVFASATTAMRKKHQQSGDYKEPQHSKNDWDADKAAREAMSRMAEQLDSDPDGSTQES